jgi:hypothetical protein
MATQTGPKIEAPHPPLARDTQGNLLPIPEGTSAWRICRQTTGRPKEIAGPDKRTLRFPLETTAEELADLCGADVYRVYALDEVGKVLDYIGTVDTTRDSRDLRNAASDSLSPTLRATQTGSTSDLRFALEAMAQMMRVNSEALRAVTESQADWVRSLASVRGFFRNAAPPYHPSQAENGDEDDQDVETAQNKTIYDVLAPLAEHLAPSAKPLVSMLTGGAGIKALNGPTAPENDGSDLAAKPSWELRDFVDLNYAAAKAKAKKAVRDGGATITAPSLQARVMADPKLMGHFVAIKSLLTPEEGAQIVALGERLGEEQQKWLIAQVSALDPVEAAALLRATLAELTEASMSTKSNP